MYRLSKRQDGRGSHQHILLRPLGMRRTSRTIWPALNRFRPIPEDDMQKPTQTRAANCLRLALVAVAIWLTVAPAAAVDGVLEINQACAVNTGCFPGDAAGFPVTLSSSSSYRLTSSLTVPINTVGILITANGVSLDLNGFTLSGPGTCTGTPVTSCVGAGSARGIDAEGVSRVTLRNGEVRGFGSQGVSVSTLVAEGNYLIENVRATENNDDGFKLGTNGTIRSCVSSRNRRSGITVDVGALVLDNVSEGNGSAGIFIVFAGAQVGYARNVLRVNSTNVSGGPTQLGPNLCDAALCP